MRIISHFQDVPKVLVMQKDERLYIREAMKCIGLIDPRSFRRWCALNNLMLYQDANCKKHFVLKSEFEHALTNSTKVAKVIQYKVSAEEMESHFHLISEYLTETVKRKKTIAKTQTPILKNKIQHKNSFISILQKVIAENRISSDGKANEDIK